MSYRCHICSATSKPGQPRTVHTVYREVQGRTEIAREIPVCSACAKRLKEGYSLNGLIEYHRAPIPAVLLPPAPPKANPIDQGKSLLRRG